MDSPLKVGDLNGVPSLEMDRTERDRISRKERLPHTFFQMVDSLNLRDAWRERNPLEKQFTLFSEA